MTRRLEVVPPWVTLAPGDAQQFDAVGVTGDGAIVGPLAVRWTVTGGSISAAGRFIASAPGVYRIIATNPASGISDTALAVVRPRIGEVDVTPDSLTLSAGATNPLHAVVRDVSGNPLPGEPVAWTTDAPNVATVDDTGLVYGVSEGAANVTARAGNASDAARIRVAGRPVAQVEVTPVAGTVPIGGIIRLSATPRDSAGRAIPGVPVDWASAEPTVAAAYGDGYVTGVSEGVTRVRALAGGTVGEAEITVTPALAGPWPNQPAGLSPISDQPWDVLTSLGWALQFGTAAIVLDQRAPLSPPSVLQITYPIGFVGGSAPGTMWRQFPAMRAVYVGIWWKASNPWQGHPSNSNKIQYLFTDSNGSMAMIMYGVPGGPYELRVFPDWHGAWLMSNVVNPSITLGVWHRIEWFVDYDGGIVRWWMDGRLLGDHRNVRLSTQPLTSYKVAPVWGGAEPVTKTELDFVWYDHVHLVGRPSP